MIWPKSASGTSLQNRMLHDDGASAITSAEERAKPLPVCVVENVQPAVASLIISVNDVPAEFADTSAVIWSPGCTGYWLGSVTEGFGYISYQA